MSSKCLVSVIMPVYNGERYVSQAVKSILGQTYSNFELIVVNDGSTDKTEKILSSFPQIIYVKQNNQGIACSLNIGINRSKGKYIVRLDADDICFPNRIEKQVNFLERNPDIDLVGSSATIIDSGDRRWGIQRMPGSDTEIRWASLFKSPFIHPSVTIRREIAEEFTDLYDPNFVPTEDYELWIRVLKNHKAANISEPLLYYRVHSKGATATANEKIKENSKIISINAFKNFLSQALNIFSPLELNQVQELLFSGTRGYKSFGEKRTQLINNYLSIWDLFMKEYSIIPEQKQRIQDQVIIKVCQLTFYPPQAKESNEIIGKLNRLDKNWPFIFLRSLPYASQAFIRERLIWKRI